MKKLKISLNQNNRNRSINRIKQTKNIQQKEIKDTIINQFKKRFQKKKNLKSSNLNSANINQKTNINIKSSVSVPYQNILDDLIKYLENKINSNLYEDINNYIHKKINTYNLDTTNINLNTNLNLNQKRNNESDIL